MKMWIACRVSRRPLFYIAVLMAAVLLASALDAWLGGFFLVAGVAILFLCDARNSAAAGCCLAGIAMIHSMISESNRHENGVELAQLGQIELFGEVLDEARNGIGWSAKVRVTSGPWKGGIVWWQSEGAVPVRGANVHGIGVAGSQAGIRNEGEFDRAKWLDSMGVAAVFRASETEVKIGKRAELAAWVRGNFRERVTAGMLSGSVGEGILRAVVLGEVPGEMHSVKEAFRLSGALHVFSVSGLHVAMMASIGWALVGRLGIPRRTSVPILIALVFGYAWLTGGNPPAIRAAWMTTVFLAAFWFRRNPDLLNALGLALVGALIWEPRLIHQAGVQLSYGVVATIGILGSWMHSRFAWMGEPELYLPESQYNWWQVAWWKLRKSVAGTFGVSAAAMIGSSPITWLHFGMITPVSIFSNLLILPLVFSMMALSMASVMVSFVSPVSGIALNRVNDKLANLSARIAYGFASIPMGHIDFRHDRVPKLRIFDLDYGAQAACFSVPGEGAVMLDCGSSYGFERVVVPVLTNFGISPDSVVLSQPEGGHVGGGFEVWQVFPVKQVAFPAIRSLSPAYRAWLNAAGSEGISSHFMASDSRLEFPGNAKLEVLHRPEENGFRGLADDRVVVTRLHWDRWRIMFHQDAGQEAEEEMIRSRQDLISDVVILGKNGNEPSFGDDYLVAVRPRVIIASNPPFPPEKRRDERQLAYWRERGVTVFDQAESGGVTLWIGKGGDLVIEGCVNKQRVVLEVP